MLEDGKPKSISRGRYPGREKTKTSGVGVAMDIVREVKEAFVALPASTVPVVWTNPGQFEPEDVAPVRRFPVDPERKPATPAAMGTFESAEAPLPALGRPDPNRVGGRGNPLNWSIYTVAELVSMRDEITQALPPLELSKINLEEEVLLQYHTLRELQGDVLADKDVPTNQKAQVANSVAAALRTLGDQQAELYSSERSKDIENLLIRSLRLWPEESAAVFIEELAQILRKHKS